MWPHASSCHNRIGDDDDDDDDEKSEIISAGDLWYASIVRIYQSIFKLPATVLVMQLKEFSLNISSSLLEIVTDLSTLKHPCCPVAFWLILRRIFPTLVQHYLRFGHFGTNFIHQEKGVSCYTCSLSS